MGARAYLSFRRRATRPPNPRLKRLNVAPVSGTETRLGPTTARHSSYPD